MYFLRATACAIARIIKQGWVGKFSDFIALSVNIPKTVADRDKVTTND